MTKSKANKEEKPAFDSTNANLVKTLNKHMQDWFDSHPGEEFISPLVFQQTYPLFDKYESQSFRKKFYAVKRRIQIGECFCFLFNQF